MLILTSPTDPIASHNVKAKLPYLAFEHPHFALLEKNSAATLEKQDDPDTPNSGSTNPDSNILGNSGNTQQPDQANRHRIRPLRRWWMPWATVCLSLTPFLLVEMSLRWFAPQSVSESDVDPFVDLHQLQPLFELDSTAGVWQIPDHRMNFFRPASFTANKAERTKRIFVLGGSTVQGRPYSTETAFATWLQLRLQATFPETNFEVVNVGGISYASYRVSKLLREVMDHDPDAIVLYTGHNEFLEDREYGDLLEAGPIRTWLSRKSGKIRTVSWLQQIFRGPPEPVAEMPQEVDARLDHIGGLGKYHRDATWKIGVEKHFDQTLRNMIQRVKSARIPLWLCMPTCDLINTPPFKLELAHDLSAQERDDWESAWQTANDDRLPSAQRLAACHRCLAIDAMDAGAHYVAGRLLYEQADSENANRHLIAARDLDVCPLRATTAIEQSVIRIAAQEDIPLILTANLFDLRDADGNRTADGIADPEFFVDHLHPSLTGHQALGKKLAEKISQHDLLSDLERLQNRKEIEQRFRTLTEKHLAGLSEAYYERGKQRLEGLRRWAEGRVGQTPKTPEN